MTFLPNRLTLGVLLITLLASGASSPAIAAPSIPSRCLKAVTGFIAELGAEWGGKRSAKTHADGDPDLPPFKSDPRVFHISGDDGSFMARNHPSVRIVQESPDSFTLERTPVENHKVAGGTRLAWGSSWSSQPGAVQGDPRNLAIIYGIEAARAFGVEVIDGNYARIPKRAAVNRGIERVNAHLPDERKIDVVYYDLRETRDVGRIYTQGLARRDGGPIRLPYSDDPNLAIHDASFHLAGMAIPRPVWDHVAATADAIDRFATFLEKRGLADLAERVLNEYSHEIDVSQGDLAYDLRSGKRAKIVRRGLEGMTLGRRSPLEAISHILEKALDQQFDADYLERPRAAGSFSLEAQESARKLNHAPYDAVAAEFHAQNPAPTYRRRFEMQEKDFLEQFGRNIGGIRQAASRLKNAGAPR